MLSRIGTVVHHDHSMCLLQIHHPFLYLSCCEDGALCSLGNELYEPLRISLSSSLPKSCVSGLCMTSPESPTRISRRAFLYLCYTPPSKIGPNLSSSRVLELFKYVALAILKFYPFLIYCPHTWTTWRPSTSQSPSKISCVKSTIFFLVLG